MREIILQRGAGRYRRTCFKRLDTPNSEKYQNQRKGRSGAEKVPNPNDRRIPHDILGYPGSSYRRATATFTDKEKSGNVLD